MSRESSKKPTTLTEDSAAVNRVACFGRRLSNSCKVLHFSLARSAETFHSSHLNCVLPSIEVRILVSGGPIGARPEPVALGLECAHTNQNSARAPAFRDTSADHCIAGDGASSPT